MPQGELTKEDRLRIQVARLKNVNTQYKQEIAELKVLVKQQANELTELKERLDDKEAQRKELLSYLYKPNNTNKVKKKGKKIGAAAYHRPKPKPSDITERISFSVSQCPVCKHTVTPKPVETVIRYEEDIDLAPRKITREYTITRHYCTHCESIVRPPFVPEIRRIGLNVMGYILYMRYRLRVPLGKIQESLLDLHDFHISQGEITDQLKEAQNLFGKDYKSISELIKTAKVVYADETGWRMDGANWWLWVFTTSQGTKYVIEDSRGKGVPQRNMGDNSDRVIVSDGYAVYKNLTGTNQQCWVHLLRKAKHVSPNLYGDLMTIYTRLLKELDKPITQRDPPYFKKQLDTIVHKQYKELQVKKVQALIARNIDAFLTCLSYDNVLPQNNTAERAIRPHVVMRKIFGGSRSVAGATAHAVNTSVIDTALHNNPDTSFFELIMPLLQERVDELHGASCS